MQSIQLISRIEDNKWWKDLFIHYASKGESFEIRCWDEEIESINLIKRFGTAEKSQTTKEIINKLEKIIDKEYEELIEWLRITVEKYNGFYILGL